MPVAQNFAGESLQPIAQSLNEMMTGIPTIQKGVIRFNTTTSPNFIVSICQHNGESSHNYTRLPQLA